MASHAFHGTMTSRAGRKLNKLTKGGGYAISLARLDALLGKRDPIPEAFTDQRKLRTKKK